MVKWYVIGYFVIGLIISVIDRVSDEFLVDEPYYEAEDPGTKLMFHVVLVLLWPFAVIVGIVITIDKSLTVLSKWIAKQIKERSKHEQAESENRDRGELRR